MASDASCLLPVRDGDRCGRVRGGDESLIEAHPVAASQFAVEGAAAHVQLFCVGGIGGSLGPVAEEPLQAAQLYAKRSDWRYASMGETGGNDTRRLFVFYDAGGDPIAEVAVANDDDERRVSLAVLVATPGQAGGSLECRHAKIREGLDRSLRETQAERAERSSWRCRRTVPVSDARGHQLGYQGCGRIAVRWTYNTLT